MYSHTFINKQSEEQKAAAYTFFKFLTACKPHSRISINRPSVLRLSRHHLIPHCSIQEEIHVRIDQILLHKTLLAMR